MRALLFALMMAGCAGSYDAGVPDVETGTPSRGGQAHAAPESTPVVQIFVRVFDKDGVEQGCQVLGELRLYWYDENGNGGEAGWVNCFALPETYGAYVFAYAAAGVSYVFLTDADGDLVGPPVHTVVRGADEQVATRVISVVRGGKQCKKGGHGCG